MFQVADVFINIPTSQIRTPFSYLIPSELGFVSRGWRVLVSFGKNNVEAFVVSIREVDEKEAGKLKSISGVLDEYAWFDEEMLATAEWVSEKYLCSPAEALRLFIPGKAGLKAEAWYEAAPVVQAEDSGILSPLLQYLRKEQAPVRFSTLGGKYAAMELAELG